MLDENCAYGVQAANITKFKLIKMKTLQECQLLQIERVPAAAVCFMVVSFHKIFEICIIFCCEEVMILIQMSC